MKKNILLLILILSSSLFSAPAINLPKIYLSQGSNEITNGDTYDYGSLYLHAYVDVTFRITNIGPDPLNMTIPLIITGTDASHFVFQSQPTSPLANSEYTEFTVRFNPTVVGPKIASISIESDDYIDNPYVINLEGVGITPEIDMEVTLLGATGPLLDGGIVDYSSQTLLSNTDGVFTIYNNGNADLIVTTPIIIDGPGASQFSVQTQPSPTISPSGSSNFTVRFTPTAGGSKTANISIRNNDRDERDFEINLSGTGLPPEIDMKNGSTNILDGASQDFGLLVIGASNDIVFTIENNGIGDLNLSTPITIVGADASQFTVQLQPANTIVPSGSTTFTVRFSPTSSGSKTAVISIINNDLDENPYDLNLAATAVPPTATISGLVKWPGGQVLENASITFVNGGPTVSSNAAGVYSATVTYGWSGTATATYGGLFFAPASYKYTNVTADQINRDYIANTLSTIISGVISWSDGTPLVDAYVAFSNGGPTVNTDANGYYETSILKGWSGTVTPSAGNVDFAPMTIDYVNIQSKQDNQDYVGVPTIVEVSGILLDANGNPITDVTLTFDDGLGKALAKTEGIKITTTDANGYFITHLPLFWSGTVTPTKDGIVFNPSSYDFSTTDTKQSGLSFTPTVTTLDVSDQLDSLPTSFTVLPAYPNPFNPTTTITYGLDSESIVNISIYDIKGQLITILHNENQTQGWHSTIWNGTDNRNNPVPAGIYISKITSNNTTRTTKLMLLK